MNLYENAALTDRAKDLLEMCDTFQPMGDNIKEEQDQDQLQQNKKKLTEEIAILEKRRLRQSRVPTL